jgi:hypothetical protein
VRLNCLLPDIRGSGRVVTDLAQFEQGCREACLSSLAVTLSSARFVSDICKHLQRLVRVLAAFRRDVV